MTRSFKSRQKKENNTFNLENADYFTINSVFLQSKYILNELRARDPL